MRAGAVDQKAQRRVTRTARMHRAQPGILQPQKPRASARRHRRAALRVGAVAPDGDEVIADTTEEGDFLAACKKFEGHIRQCFPRAAAA